MVKNEIIQGHAENILEEVKSMVKPEKEVILKRISTKDLELNYITEDIFNGPVTLGRLEEELINVKKKKEERDENGYIKYRDEYVKLRGNYTYGLLLFVDSLTVEDLK